MAFLKNILNVLTDRRDITEPEIYKGFNEDSTLVSHLTKLAESNDPTIDRRKIENHVKLFSIGQTGEKNVLFELQHSMLPMVVLHDVYIEFEDYHAQLDFVIITHKFILVLEVKKLFGNIYVTDKGEFQRVITKNNRVVNKEGMYSPINQVERHVAILEKLLKANGTIENCPVKYAVTFANPKTILDISKKAPAHIQKSVIRHDQIKTFIKKELEKKSPVLMLDKQLYAIADTILKYSKEKTLNIQDYKLDTPQPSPKDSANETPSENRDNTSVDLKLNQALTDFRLRRSKELKIKPYYIFTNKILDSLIEKKPATMDQLLEIEGFGQKKVEELGKDLLSIIQSTFSEETLPLNDETVKLNKSVNKMNSSVQSNEDRIKELKAALTAFRTKRSKELNVKPYYIFTNNTLESILDNKPGTTDDLLKIDGIGPKKAEEFGQEILDILQNTNKS